MGQLLINLQKEEMIMENIERLFDECASNYDSLRKQLIPCFDRFYSSALSIVQIEETNPIKVLDLGAGTGLMSYFILKQCPNAFITLIDLSEAMLGQARSRLKEFTNQVEIIKANYLGYPFKENYDLVISSLSIHHLDGPEKKQLFKEVYHCLKPNGQFINADQVLGRTAAIDSHYKTNWLRAVQSRGVPTEELTKAFERMKEDKMSTLEEQLQWLNDLGYRDVNCWYKDYSFVVYSGSK